MLFHCPKLARPHDYGLGKGKGDGKCILFNVGGQTGKNRLLTWEDGGKVADRRDRAANVRSESAALATSTTGPHTGEVITSKVDLHC